MNAYNAKWWSSADDSSWGKVKDAFRRTWAQTKHDFGSGKAPELNQDVPDTVKQAAGKEAIPSRRTPNFDEHESAFRFGYGARRHYGNQYPSWNDSLERDLRNDWSTSRDYAEWTKEKNAIRRTYEYH